MLMKTSLKAGDPPPPDSSNFVTALKTFADDAAQDPDNRYVMVIDEINRANLSKVLGELFFLLEYRDETANLQYSDTAFSLPKNLFIIGTMNTADRSIAMVDAALRRRFHFTPFSPPSHPSTAHSADSSPTTTPLTWVADMVDKANQQLPMNLGIGPSHFMRPNLTEQLIQRIWTHSILPYIEDNFDYDKNALQPFTYDAEMSNLINLTEHETSEPVTLNTRERDLSPTCRTPPSPQ